MVEERFECMLLKEEDSRLVTSAVVKNLARKWKLDLSKYDRHTMKLVRVEAGLIRLRRVLSTKQTI